MLVDGKKITQSIQEALQRVCAGLSRAPVFSIIYVGNDPVIDQFIGIKKRFGQKIGVDVQVYRFDESIEMSDLKTHMTQIEQVSDAMIVQLPLPASLDRDAVTSLVPLSKDVDVLSPITFDAFKKREINFMPPVAGAIMHILKYYNIDLRNKKTVLVGMGRLVGIPTQILLQQNNIEAQAITKDTWEQSLSQLAEADVVISGVGAGGLIRADMVQDGVVLIDAGTSESEGSVVGDVDPECFPKAFLATPVPGGVGPITVAVLFENVLQAWKDSV